MANRKIDIRITDEEVNEWKAEMADIEKQIEQLQVKKQKLGQKLELVNLIIKDNDSGTDLLTDVPSNEANTKKPAIVMTLLRETGGYMSPLQIKQALKKRGEAEEDWQPKYVYVHQILSRLVSQGKVVRGKTNRKYKLADAI